MSSNTPHKSALEKDVAANAARIEKSKMADDEFNADLDADLLGLSDSEPTSMETDIIESTSKKPFFTPSTETNNPDTPSWPSESFKNLQKA